MDTITETPVVETPADDMEVIEGMMETVCDDFTSVRFTKGLGDGPEARKLQVLAVERLRTTLRAVNRKVKKLVD